MSSMTRLQACLRFLMGISLFVGGLEESLLSMRPSSRQSQLSAGELNTKVLVEMAERHRMPMPSKEARLVLAHTGSHKLLGNRSTSRDPAVYSPAFLEEETKDSVVILRGFVRKTLEKRREPAWRPFSMEPVQPMYDGYAVEFGQTSTFICAIQLAARGEHATAQKLWNRFLETNQFEVVGGEFEARGGQLVRKFNDQPSWLLALSLVEHLHRRVLTHPAEWKGTLDRIEAILIEAPEVETENRRQLVDDLEATVDAKPPVPDSTEALLLSWSKAPGAFGPRGLDDENDDTGAEAPARRIVMRGLTAIPDLIALLDDKRVTVHESPAVMRAPARIHRVGELAETLLEEIAGSRKPSIGRGNTSAVWRAWWAQTRNVDPADFFASAVFEREEGKIMRAYASPARILAEHFPQRLRPLCEEFSENSEERALPDDLAKAVAFSRLPANERVKVLSEFAMRGSLEQRRPVLQALARVNGAEAARILKPLFERFPRDSKEPYWTCPEAAYTHLIMQIEDDNIWAEYSRVVHRSSVGLRMEMLNPLNYSYISARNRNRRLALLATFLDDVSERRIQEDDERFEGPCAAFTIRRIHVRDFAALQIASILDLADDPDEFWTVEQWGALRATVRARLAAEALPTFDAKVQ